MKALFTRMGFGFILLTSASGAFAQTAAPPYVGKDGTEANVAFSSSVELAATSAPSAATVRAVVDRQLSHMISRLRESGEATPRGDYRIRIRNVVADPARGIYRADYDYAGRFAVKNGVRDRIRLLLPIRPDLIFRQSLVNGATACAKEPGQGVFWYYWNPSLSGCPLRPGLHYHSVQAPFERIANTARTYPEYDRLIPADGILRVAVFFGKINSGDSDAPEASGTGYPDFRAFLRNAGFQGRRMTAAEIRARVPKPLQSPVHVEEHELMTERARVRVTLFHGHTGIADRSNGFHWFLKDALETASVVMYNGHAGMGSNLDLARIERREGFKIKPALNRYQILLVNACFPHFYYVSRLFKWKARAQDPNGTRNLDIMADGVEGYFHHMAPTSEVLLRAVLEYTRREPSKSWQKIVSGAHAASLFGVNGDEDNPTRPIE